MNGKLILLIKFLFLIIIILMGFFLFQIFTDTHIKYTLDSTSEYYSVFKNPSYDFGKEIGDIFIKIVVKINFEHTLEIALYAYPVEAKGVLDDLKRKITEMEATIATDIQHGRVMDPAVQAALEDAQVLQEELVKAGLAKMEVYKDRGELKYMKRLGK